MRGINIRAKSSIAAISTLVFLVLASCVSSGVEQGPSQAESPNTSAAQQVPNDTPTASQSASVPTTLPTASQPARVPTAMPTASQSASVPTAMPTVPQTTSVPTTMPTASPLADSITATATQATATRIVQTPRILSTATRTPSPVPTETPVVGVTSTPTRTPTPTPANTGLPVQKQMSEAAFRTLMAAFDSGEIAQERGCLPIPELGDLRAKVLHSTRDDVDFESYSLTGFPLPFIVVLDIERTLSGAFFDSRFLFPRNEELPGISSEREVVALINVCSNAKIPTTMRVESKDMRWTLYVVTGS